MTEGILLLGDGWGPAVLLVPLAALIVVLRGRFFLNLFRRLRNSEIDPKDDWDPFR